MSLQSPLGRVLGRGAAKDGVHHWWLQRLTSVALVPLSIWLIVSLAVLPVRDYASVAQWLGHTFPALLMMLFVLTAAWHSQLGLRVIFEDYVHERGMRTAILMLSTFVHVVVAAAGVLAVLQILLRSTP
jgi:succinate dehydrogenase / fumarate reductase membrane anchor subunit